LLAAQNALQSCKLQALVTQPRHGLALHFDGAAIWAVMDASGLLGKPTSTLLRAAVGAIQLIAITSKTANRHMTPLLKACQ
jgi:hypothetical protein